IRLRGPSSLRGRDPRVVGVFGVANLACDLGDRRLRFSQTSCCGVNQAEMKMLDKTEQSDRAPNPNEKRENCYCSALPKGSGLCLPLLYAMGGRQGTPIFLAPVIREKSQFRAQDDSLSLSL